MRAATAIAQGMWMRLPNGVSTHTRQSPSSSRQRSTTIVRSSGTWPVASAWSARKRSRFSAAPGSRSCSLTRRVSAAACGKRAQLAHHGADAAAKFERAAGTVALPERHLARLAGSGRHQHAVVRDVGDAPRGRAEDERLVGVRLEDHLLVELAHAHRLALSEGEKDAVEAAIGDGSGVQNRQPRRAVARRDHVAHAIPRQPRAQLGKLVGRVAAAEQIEHALEGRARKRAERRGSAHEVEEKIDGDFRLCDSALSVSVGSRPSNFNSPAEILCSSRRSSMSSLSVHPSPGAQPRQSPPTAAPARPAGCAESAWTRCGPRAWRA